MTNALSSLLLLAASFLALANCDRKPDPAAERRVIIIIEASEEDDADSLAVKSLTTAADQAGLRAKSAIKSLSAGDIPGFGKNFSAAAGQEYTEAQKFQAMKTELQTLQPNTKITNLKLEGAIIELDGQNVPTYRVMVSVVLEPNGKDPNTVPSEYRICLEAPALSMPGATKTLQEDGDAHIIYNMIQQSSAQLRISSLRVVPTTDRNGNPTFYNLLERRIKRLPDNSI